MHFAEYNKGTKLLTQGGMMSQREELYKRKQRAMELMKAGESWQEANEQSGLKYSRTGIQRLYREWNKNGEEALKDNRHGHPHKATSKVQEWMREEYTENSKVRGSQLVVDIEAQFGIELTPQYVSVLRRQLGLPVPKPGRPSRQEGEATRRRETEGDFSPSGSRGQTQRISRGSSDDRSDGGDRSLASDDELAET